MKSFVLTILSFMIFFMNYTATACTGFTSSNDTLVFVGNNEDWWQEDPQIMFVPPTANTYGYVCFGFQYNPSYWHAFGAVNDQGLFHDAFSVPTLQVTTNLNNPYYNGNLAVLAMEECATVQEVVALYSQYNLSFLSIEQHFFVDRTGASVIIEGDTVFYNSGDPQAVANFRFSNKGLGGWPSWRYENATNMINNNNHEVSVDHYRTILDQVHLNTFYWETKYSNICDLKNNVIYLFINHDYESVAELHIDDELRYGYNLYDMSNLQFHTLPPILPELVNPTFDQGILLVNGLSLDTTSNEKDNSLVWNSYESKAFWGDYPITFWECSKPPTGGYPSTLPNPIGQDQIPPDVLGQYSTVIWVSDFNGKDIVNWRRTPILSYMEAGGNLMFIARAAQFFIDGDIQAYLGLTWGGDYGYTTINNCLPVFSGMNVMLNLSVQNYNALFETNFSDTTRHLLFQDNNNLPNGIGVWYRPENGGIFNNTGGQFVYIAGSPYKYNPDHLRPNITFMLENFFHESLIADVNDSDNMTGKNNKLFLQNYPNPFNHTTTIKYRLSTNTNVCLDIFNIKGQKIKSLVKKQQQAGDHEITWKGRNEQGHYVPSGLYIYRLSLPNYSMNGKTVLIK
jgi:hypothetical protein